MLKFGSAVALLGAVGALAFLAGWKSHPSAAPTLPPGSHVQVDSIVAVTADAPVPAPPLVQRITTHAIEPVMVAVSKQIDLGPLHRYCTPLVVTVPSTSDSTAPRAVLPPFSGRLDRDGRLRLWSTLSEGQAFLQDTRTHGAPLSWLSADSVVVVREERGWVRFLRGAERCALGAGLGAGSAFVLGADAKRAAVIGGGLGCSASIIF